MQQLKARLRALQPPETKIAKGIPLEEIQQCALHTHTLLSARRKARQ